MVTDYGSVMISELPLHIDGAKLSVAMVSE